ncbi:MAG: WYL domain-containing protein [Oscillospiraceae bacterium]|nr:WYL domain-containing protein [Oscillospiraceae bacterium]
MAAGDKQGLKMLYLMKIFTEETDETHPLTTPDLIRKLSNYGVNEERRTLYRDLDLLQEYGLDIIQEKVGRQTFYYLGHRNFELPELKLLVDSVQSAKFITERKSRELIKKLESFAGIHDAKHLHRQVVITGRVKTMNESIYYNVDLLHEAINSDRKIRFRYYQWNTDKKMEFRHDGAWYEISPWALMWDDENYYLVAYDDREGRIKHYRVDKMVNLSVSENGRLGKEEFRSFDIARYSKGVFGMFGGEIQKVTVRAENHMVGIFIDRFGKELIIVPDGQNHFTTTIEVAVSGQFLGWIVSLGHSVKVVAPDAVVERMQQEIRRLCGQYFQNQ